MSLYEAFEIKGGHLLPEATTLEIAPISTLPLVGRKGRRISSSVRSCRSSEPRITTWT
jgi:hypothetical protein